MDLEVVPEALGIMWEYTMDTHIHTEEQFSLADPPTIMLWGSGWKPGSFEEFHVEPRRTPKMKMQ